MARRTFFSFHYDLDVSRAQVVKNSWVAKPNREQAGFFDGSVIENRRRQGGDVLKRFLTEALDGASVTCVLMGAETYLRPWVRYELVRSFQQGKGMLGVWINAIKNLRGETATAGGNSFDYLAFRVANDRVYWQEKNGEQWTNYDAVPSMALADVAYDLGGRTHHTFSTLFRVHRWVADNGYENLGSWVETAATQAGR